MHFLDDWKRRLTALSEERFYLALLAVMAFVVALTMTLFGLGLHRNFLTIACDTAEFQSAIVNTLNGHWFRVSAYDGPNLLGSPQHAMFVLLLIAPIYALIPTPDTLFTLQIWGVYSAVIPLYLVACQITDRPLTAFILAATALASPLFFQMALAPFHPESWMAAAVLWSYFFYRRNNTRGFWISLLFTLNCGEQAALLFIVLGISWLVWDDGIAWRQRYGKIALGTGLGWLILTTGLLAPLMHTPAQVNDFAYHYSNWNIDSVFALANAAISDPLKTLGLLLSPGRWLYVLSLLGLPLVAAFFSRRFLLLLVPFPLYFLMCDQEFFLYFHAYYFQFAFLAGYLGFMSFLSRREGSTRAAASMLGVTLFLNVLLLFPSAVLYLNLDLGRNEALSVALHRAFADIPREAAVYSPHRYSAYLSNREKMVMGDLREENLDFNAMIDAQFLTTTVHSSDIDYIVCDVQNDQCGWRQGGYNPATAKVRAANINRLLQSGKWRVQWSQDDVVILRRNEQ